MSYGRKPKGYTSLGYWDPPLGRDMEMSSGLWPEDGDHVLMKDSAPGGVQERSPVYFKAGKDNKHFQLVDGEGRIACVQGDWVRFYTLDKIGDRDTQFSIEEECGGGYHYMKLAGRWLCVARTGLGIMNVKNEGWWALSWSGYKDGECISNP